MNIEIRWRRGNKENIENIRSLIFLGNVHTFEEVSPTIFVHGPQNLIGELFAWGAYSWPTICPFEPKTIEEISLILRTAAKAKWGPQLTSDLVQFRQPKVIRGDDTKEFSSFKFILDSGVVTVTGVEDCLMFVEAVSGKKFCSDGWGSEKKELLFYATEQLYGEATSHYLRAAIYGQFAEMAGQMLKSFRANDAPTEGIVLTPEAWEELAKEKFAKEFKEGKHDVSPN